MDEAWATGAQLAEAVLELLKAKKPFTKENLEATYVQRRRASWVEQEARAAEKSRDGFQHGVLTGLIGMALAGLSGGRLACPANRCRPWERIPSLEDYYSGRIPPAEVRKIRDDCYARGVSAHAALMERAGWPAIPYDGQLLVSHQDALLMGGKVQAPPGYADHVAFVFPNQCQRMRHQAVRGSVFRPGHHTRRKRRAGFRPREMRPLRRVPLELRVRLAGKSRAACPSPSAPGPAGCTRRRIDRIASETRLPPSRKSRDHPTMTVIADSKKRVVMPSARRVTCSPVRTKATAISF